MQVTSEQMLNAGMTEEQVNKLLALANKQAEVISKQSNSELKVTSINDLNNYVEGQIVKLPDFSEGQPLIAKLKRPSILSLASKGKIPNSLLSTASKMFSGNGGTVLDSGDEEALKDIYKICHVLAEEALVEPTLAQIESAGLSLTDEQFMALFNYTQAGVRALENFR